ncbi:MAG: hypothetical protein ACYDB1_12000 [Acidiferrobacteraceae bacterium]
MDIPDDHDERAQIDAERPMAHDTFIIAEVVVDMLASSSGPWSAMEALTRTQPVAAGLIRGRIL